MTDAIDRQAAIDVVEGGAELIRRVLDNMDVVIGERGKFAYGLGLLESCIEELSGLPSAQPEPKWIPCSERLPEKNGRYLVTRGLKACNSIWNRVYIVNYTDLMGLKPKKIWWEGNVGKSDFQKIDDVIAWKPLEEPYKGEQE